MSASTFPFGDNPLQSREDFQRAVNDLVDPLVPAIRAEGARVRLGSAAAVFDAATESLESFIRPLWGLVPLAAGGGSFAHWDLIREGLARGTDPKDSHYWGGIGATPGADPRSDQRKVEMAAVGLALTLTPDQVFFPLIERQRDQVMAWLAEINSGSLVENNWQFFRVMVNLGFARIGGPVDEAANEESLRKIDSYYLGNGWYQDGTTLGTTDFYNPFALHFYGLIYAARAAEQDPQRAAVFRERASLFARHWEARFDTEGRVIPYGRSMTYRFAGASFWGALAFAGVEALPWGRIRSLWAKHLRWWATQPIATSNGRLSIGWAYENQHMRETYNSPGSPYWAMKAFLPLALAEDHPFWTADEEDHEQPESRLIQPEAGVVVNRAGTQVTMLNSGRPGRWFPRQGAAKYGKLAYSSAFPLTLEPDDPMFFHTAESALALIDQNNIRLTRHSTSRAGIDDGVAWSIWEPFDDVTVLTVLGGTGPVHRRVHVVDTARPLEAIEGGFAIEDRFDPTDSDQVQEVNGARAKVSHVKASSIIVDLAGKRAAKVVRLQPNSSMQWPRTIAPILTSELTPGRHLLTSTVGAVEAPELIRESELPETVEDLQSVVNRYMTSMPGHC